MTTPAHLPLPLAKRATLLLAAASAIGGAVAPVSVGLGGLVGAAQLGADRQALATLPITVSVVGAALASIPAALSMRRIGRRAGFIVGAALGALGAATAVVAIQVSSFVVFLCSMLLIGASNAFRQQYRFAAADASEPAFKARAISWVLAGGVFTGVIGPQVAIHGRGWLFASPFAGPFVLAFALSVGSALLLALLQVPPPAPRAEERGGRPVLQIILGGRFLVAQIVAIASYALMSLVMTATPLAMVAHHHSQDHAQVAIQWHVIAMFAPAFVTGRVIAWIGKQWVAALGLTLIAVAAVIALLGTGLAHFYTALILLGVGWSFGFVASTAMVAQLYQPSEAFRVQAVSEFVLFGVVALASYLSGEILSSSGWDAVNYLVFPVVVLCLLLLGWQGLAERSRARR
ncbi:MAG: MFS transporter [Kofleriaceae bacterium]